jgi:predicted flap endonuclease-1-like 5' DNA nuclease
MAFRAWHDMLHCNMAGPVTGRTSTGVGSMALSHEFSREFPGAAVVGERAERALRVPFGVVSPLWAMFGAAAGAGIAYWWMTSWTRAVNFEALSAFTPKMPAPIPAAKPKMVEIVAEPVVAPVVAVAEAVAEAVAPKTTVEPEPELKLEPVVAKPAAVAKAVVDDLTRMTGIGPKLSAALAELGVTSFAQIAGWTADDLAKMDAELSLKGRAVREAWVSQAKRLAKG